MSQHGSSPQNQGAKPTPKPLTDQALARLLRDIDPQLDEAVGAQVIYLSPARFFAALELIDEATTAAVLTVRTVIAL